MLISEAREFAYKCHEGQFRKYHNQPYIVHPARVAKEVSKYTDSEYVVAAAWLHDVVEDCGVSFGTIAEKFGMPVSTLVGWLTNPSKTSPHLNRAARKEMDRNHIGNSPAEAQLIKVVDRLDNLNDIVQGPKDFQKLYAKESILLANVLKLAPENLVKELKDKVGTLLF